MCKWGTTTEMEVFIPARLSRTDRDYMKKVGVDSCIASFVQKLNGAGITTIASCCGHDKRPGSIILEDGMELIIAKDWDEGRRIDEILNKNGYSPIN